MIKNNKIKAAVSSLLVLLPMLFGFIFWSKLPPLIVTHWGADTVPDGTSSRLFAVLFLPLILLALHWLGLLITAWDHRKRTQSAKVLGLTFWIMPVISLTVNGLMYATALGNTPYVGTALCLLIGGGLAIMGNYLPKCTQNRTFGIKLIWTLSNEENWNATHRLGGKVFVVGGLIIMAAAFLPPVALLWVLIPVFAAMLIIPTLYSYRLYKAEVAAGKAPEKPVALTKGHRLTAVVVTLLTLALLAFVTVICFTGDIVMHYGDEALEVEASYYGDLTIRYADIDSITYREGADPGMRQNGFGSPRLSMGLFQNEEFGTYIRYAYTNCPAEVVLEIDGKIFILGGKTAEDTHAIYEKLSLACGQGEGLF